MFKVQQNRYLWVHLVGLAAVPLLLDICLAGLASTGAASPFGFQFWMVAIVGIVPSAWMQIQRPFYIYSLPPLAVKPASLSENDRRCLTVLKSWQIKALAGVTAGFSLWLLIRLYDKLPQVLPVMEPRAGLVSAIAAFFFACLFLQISVSVVRSLLIGQDTLNRVKPIEPGKVASSFFIPGIRVRKILPTGKIGVEKSDAYQADKADRKKPPTVEQVDTEPTKVEPEKVELTKVELTKVKEQQEIAHADFETDNLDIETEEPSEEAKGEPGKEATRDVDPQETDVDKLKDSEQVESIAADSLPVEPLAPPIEEALAPENAEADSVPEDPPLVIPEIIESDDFDFNGNR